MKIKLKKLTEKDIKERKANYNVFVKTKDREMKNIKSITDGHVIELAKLIKTNNWSNSKEVTYWEKFQTEPFYEMFGHCKSYAINSIYYNKNVWDFLTRKGYDIGEFRERSLPNI